MRPFWGSTWWTWHTKMGFDRGESECKNHKTLLVSNVFLQTDLCNVVKWGSWSKRDTSGFEFKNCWGELIAEISRSKKFISDMWLISSIYTICVFCFSLYDCIVCIAMVTMAADPSTSLHWGPDSWDLQPKFPGTPCNTKGRCGCHSWQLQNRYCTVLA